LIDKYGRIFAVLAGQPHSAAYAAAAHGAFIDIMKAGAGACFPADMRRHRRGLYAVINVGLSYGQGQRIPGWLDNKEYSNLADGLLASTNVKRLAGFADGLSSIPVPPPASSPIPQRPSPFGPRDCIDTTTTTMPPCTSAIPTCVAPLGTLSFFVLRSISGPTFGHFAIAMSSTWPLDGAPCKHLASLIPPKAGTSCFGT
jgi:hypothetical protein